MATAPIKEVIVAQNAPEMAAEPKKGDCSLVSSYNWDARIAYAICMAESGGNPQAHNKANSNGSDDKGLMQINSIHVNSGLIGDNERLDPQKNLDAAYAIYKGSGFTAWSAYNNKSYLKWY